MNESQNYTVLVTGRTGLTAHLCVTADSPEQACAQAKAFGYIGAQVMRVAHSNAHDDLQIANNGITFDVEGGQAWFSTDRFERESERITLSTGQDADGQPEVGYINQTENFGGRFTGV